MDNTKDNAYYIEKIKSDLSFICEHMKNLTLQEFSKDEVLQDSMMFRMVQISENVKKLTTEYKQENSHLPWMALSGLRNRIVHDYGNVDMEIVYYTLTEDIPELLEEL